MSERESRRMVEAVAPVCGDVPFAGRTGKGVTVAVIDSGVHPAHDHIRPDSIGPGVMVMTDGAIVAGEEAWLDRLGHGTAVAAALQEKAPDARYLPVRVFRDALKTSSAALLAGLRWSVEQRVDVINLSLGALNPAHRDAFSAAVDEAMATGVVVVAAREANGVPCYPGALPGVIGVELDWELSRATYAVRSEGSGTAFLASGYPRAIPGVPPQRNLYGVSFATAQVCGFVARACEGLQSRGRDRVKEVRARLERAVLS